jgi:hypothetical protein
MSADQLELPTENYVVTYRYVDTSMPNVDHIFKYDVEATTAYWAERAAFDLLSDDVKDLFHQFSVTRIWRCTTRKLR